MPTLLTSDLKGETQDERDDAVVRAERRLKSALKSGANKATVDRAFAALEKARRQESARKERDTAVGRLKQEVALAKFHDDAKALRIKRTKITEQIYATGPEVSVAYEGIKIVVKPCHTDAVVSRTALEGLRRALTLLMADCERRAELANDGQPDEVHPKLVARLRDEMRLAIQHDCAVVVGRNDV